MIGNNGLMELPENRHYDRKYSSKLTMLLYGRPMIGKTHFASTLDDPIILSTDGNYRGVSCSAVTINFKTVVPLDATTNTIKDGWLVFKDYVEAIRRDDTYKTVVVDLISDIIQMCRGYVLTKNGWSHEQDAPYGAAYDKVRTEFNQPITDLINSGKNVIFVTHGKEITDSKGNVENYIPDIANQFYNKLTGKIDAVALLDFYYDELGNKVADENGSDIRILRFDQGSNRWNIDGMCIATYNGLKQLINEKQINIGDHDE